MKIKKCLSIILSMACIATLCAPAHAGEARASAQIAAYNMYITPHSGEFSVFFTVTGPGDVDKLGCESIYFYKMVDNRWVLEESRFENDSGMSSKNTYAHTNSLRFSSERGFPYKVVITIFSENSKGRDTRSETFYDIGQ